MNIDFYKFILQLEILEEHLKKKTRKHFDSWNYLSNSETTFNY